MTYKEIERREQKLFKELLKLIEQLKREYQKQHEYTLKMRTEFRYFKQDIKRIDYVPGFHNKREVITCLRRDINKAFMSIYVCPVMRDIKLTISKKLTELTDLYSKY